MATRVEIQAPHWGILDTQTGTCFSPDVHDFLWIFIIKAELGCKKINRHGMKLLCFQRKVKHSFLSSVFKKESAGEPSARCVVSVILREGNGHSGGAARGLNAESNRGIEGRRILSPESHLTQDLQAALLSWARGCLSPHPILRGLFQIKCKNNENVQRDCERNNSSRTSAIRWRDDKELVSVPSLC